MDECNSCYGKQKVDWCKFTHTIVSSGLFISIVSAFILCCALVGGNTDVSLFFACVAFGFALTVEGTFASFFKVGD